MAGVRNIAGDDERRELRLALLRGELQHARLVADQIAKGETDGGQASQFRKTVAGVLAGVEATKRGDLRSASVLFEQFTGERSSQGLRWLAMWWRALVLGRTGEFEDAEALAVGAMELAQGLDPESVGLTGCLFAELEALDGAVQPALDRVEGVVVEFGKLGATPAVAFARLTQARILAAATLEAESVVAAEEAHALDRNWSDPILFLSRAAQRLGEMDRARALLHKLRDNDAAEVQLERSILELVQAEMVPPWAVAEFQALREEMSAETVVGQLQMLATQCPDFHHVKECLGWKLEQLGQHEEAAKVFDALVAIPLPGPLQVSVQLGLRCASEGLRQRVPGAAAEAAGRDDFTGDLQMLPVPELLEFLGTTRRNGQLVLSRGDQTATICLNAGKLIGASSPDFRHVGQRLHAAGKVSPQQLAEMCPQGVGAAMGWVPVPGLDRDVLIGAFTEQVRLAVGELVSWSDGRFSFRTRQRCPDVEIDVDLEVQPVLLEALRQLDEDLRDAGETPDRSKRDTAEVAAVKGS